MKTIFKNSFAVLLTLCIIFTAAIPFINSNAAATETINVVTKLEDAGGYSVSYSYNSNGLITKKNDNGSTYKFTYNKKGLLTKMKSSDETTTYTYDKKNRLTKKSSKDSYGFKTTTTYQYNKKNLVTKAVYKESGPEAMGTPMNYAYTYNKKGYVTKEKHTGFQTETITYTYDDNGNLKKAKYSEYTTTVENTYEDGRLVSQSSKDKGKYTDSSSDRTYTYKEVTVPKKYAKTVKAQQRSILNNSIPRFVY